MQLRGLAGKVAIVTGGASGIGAAASRRFAREGAKVVIGDINGDGAAAVAAEIGENALAVQFDALDVNSIKNLVDGAVAHFEGVNFLYNNAALLHAMPYDTNPVDIDFEWWDKVFAGNVRGYMAGCKYTIPHILKAGGGSIVMTSSSSAMLGDLSMFAYGASKAAVLSLVNYIATIYGKQGIRCNAISPGMVLTEGARKNISDEIETIMLENTLTPHLGDPDDVAATAVFLCSDDAKYITGQNIGVDGGLRAHLPYFADMNRQKIEWRVADKEKTAS